MTTDTYSLHRDDFDRSTGIFTCMIGQVCTSISGLEKGSEDAVFRLADGTTVKFYHAQGCCETVQIEDVCGDTSDLIGSPILQAEEVSGEAPAYDGESVTWTFYKFSTIKGSVTVRWLGESNGYYSEDVAVEVSK